MTDTPAQENEKESCKDSCCSGGCCCSKALLALILLLLGGIIGYLAGSHRFCCKQKMSCPMMGMQGSQQTMPVQAPEQATQAKPTK